MTPVRAVGLVPKALDALAGALVPRISFRITRVIRRPRERVLGRPWSTAPCGDAERGQASSNSHRGALSLLPLSYALGVPTKTQ